VNSLEERVRAAVRATASEIGPDDVPPLRPVGSGSGARNGGLDRHRRPGRCGGGPRGPWQWGVPLAAAAAVLAIVATASLLADVRPSPAPHPAAAKPSKPTHHKGAAASYPPNLEAGLIGWFLPASGAQFTAGALFTGEFRVLEAKISSVCMAGYGYRVPVTLTPAEVARAFWDLTQFPDLGAIARAGTLPSYSVEQPPAESKAYQEAAAHCDKLSLAPFTPMSEAGGSLGDLFGTTVANIQASAPVTATMPELRTCAARYGWPHDPYGPDRPINSFADFVTWVSGYLDGAGSRGASTAQMNALDRHWGTVFVQCARPTVAVMEKLQLAAQKTFLREHQRQFAALVTVARADFARAERLARG
jgi:hypothetical protein